MQSITGYWPQRYPNMSRPTALARSNGTPCAVILECLSEAASLGVVAHPQPSNAHSTFGPIDTSAFLTAHHRTCDLQASIQAIKSAIPIVSLEQPSRLMEEARLLKQAASVLHTIERDRRQLVSCLQGLSSRATVAVEPAGQAALLQLLQCAAADTTLLAHGHKDAAWARHLRTPPSAWAEQLQPLLNVLQALRSHQEAQARYRAAQGIEAVAA